MPDETTPAAAPPVPSEYLVEDLPVKSAQEMTKTLNERGKQGWTLFWIAPHVPGQTFRAVFSRPTK